MTKRLFTPLFVAALVILGLASPASADSDDSQPTLLSTEKIDWIAGTSEWVHLSWTSADELENVQVQVTEQSKGLSIEYPSDADFSSLSFDDTLSANEIDFTALKVTTDPSVRGTQRALVEISWDNGKERERATGSLQFSNKKYKGEDFAILTEGATITADPAGPELNWVELAYKGLAPTTNNMQITVSGPLPVYHPQETFTSLHHDQTLHSGEIDVARVWFDPELSVLGLHGFTVTIDYTDSNGKSKSTSHDVSLTVGG